MHSAASKCKPSRSCSSPIDLDEFDSPIDQSLMPVWICIIGLVIFLAVNFIWFLVV
jgi:hypothetical protein